MPRPKCPGHALSPRALPHCSAPWVGVLCPEPPKAGAGGRGLSALLTCEISISFQSDVMEADTPAPMSVFPPENVSCQEIYLPHVHPLRSCSEQGKCCMFRVERDCTWVRGSGWLHMAGGTWQGLEGEGRLSQAEIG